MCTRLQATVLNAGSQTLSVQFTPSNTNYASSTTSVTLQVNPAATTVAWTNPAAIIYGTWAGQFRVSTDDTLFAMGFSNAGLQGTGTIVAGQQRTALTPRLELRRR